MSDVTITKSMISDTLKLLLNTLNFKKITVDGICRKCGINRKTFYYHFKDKYDLVNRTFDTEILQYAGHKESASEFLFAFCEYIYSERKFYSKVMEYNGQNSFKSHLKDFMLILVKIYTSENECIADDFTAEYIATANTEIIAEYISKPDMNISEFSTRLDSVIKKIIALES